MWFTYLVRILPLLFLSALFPGYLVAQTQVPDTPVPDAPSIRAAAVKPEKLKAIFQPGKTYRFINKTNIRMQLPGRGIREMVLEHQARFDSSARADGKSGAQIKARTERLAVEVRSGEKQLTFDSLKPEDRETPIGKHFLGSLNRWVDLTLNKDYRVTNAIEGGRAGVATPLPELPQFGPRELQKIVAQIPQGLPEDEVAPGDEWIIKGSRDVGDVGTLGFEVTYIHAGAVEYEGFNCIQIDLSGRLNGDVAFPSAKANPLANDRMDFQGTSLSGRILFEPTEKTVRLSEQSISMLMEVPTQPGQAPMQVPVEQQINLRLLHVIPSPQ